MVEETPKVQWDSTWRQIPDFPDFYINQYAQVFNSRRNRLVKDNYSVEFFALSVYLSKKVKGKWIRTNRGLLKLMNQMFPEGVENGANQRAVRARVTSRARATRRVSERKSVRIQGGTYLTY